MTPNVNRGTERNVACADLVIDTILKLRPQDSERFDPKTYLEIAARAVARAVLGHNADHGQAVQIIGARSD